MKLSNQSLNIRLLLQESVVLNQKVLLLIEKLAVNIFRQKNKMGL